MKIRLLICMVVTFVGAQLSAGYVTTNRSVEAVIPCWYMVLGTVTVDPLALIGSLLGGAMVSLRAHRDSQRTNSKSLEIGTKIVQIAIPALLAWRWYKEKDVQKAPRNFIFQEFLRLNETLDEYKNRASFRSVLDVAATFAEAAIQICC